MSDAYKNRVDYRPFTIWGDQEGLPVITRVCPREDGFEFEWIDTGDRNNEQATVRLTYDRISWEEIAVKGRLVDVKGRRDRLAEFTLETPDGRVSRRVRVQCAKYPGLSVVNYLHPDDNRYDFSGSYLCSPSIIRNKKGELLVSMDLFEREKPTFLTVLCKSTDDGKTWRYVCDIAPMYWGSLFSHNDKLYILGVTTGCCQLTLAESEDDGNTWRSVLIGPRGFGSVKGNGPHKAPVRVERCAGRLWISVEWGSWLKQGFFAGAFSVSEDEDIMNPDNWKGTGFLPHPDGGRVASIEGSVIETFDGRLVDFLRRSENKAHIVELDKNNPEKQPVHDRFIECPFAHTKFQIEKINGAFYAVGNECPYRNKLAVYKSDDLKSWTEIGVIQDYSDLPPNLVGVQYPDFIVEGDQLLVAVRTAVNGAHDFHDSNCITFHRFRI